MDIVACSGSTAVAAGRTFGLDVVEHQKTFNLSDTDRWADSLCTIG